MNAQDIKVGQFVEFEPGSPVLVIEIEPNFTGSDVDPHAHTRALYGESLVFSCSYTATDLEQAALEGANTFYIRRERSPVSGSRVVR